MAAHSCFLAFCSFLIVAWWPGARNNAGGGCGARGGGGGRQPAGSASRRARPGGMWRGLAGLQAVHTAWACPVGAPSVAEGVPRSPPPAAVPGASKPGLHRVRGMPKDQRRASEHQCYENCRRYAHLNFTKVYPQCAEVRCLAVAFPEAIVAAV